MLKDFAERHRLKLTKDECGDPVILGRIYQSNIYEHSDTELGVMFITDGKKPPRTGLWKRFQAACLGAGMIARQEGDTEGAFSFDPTNHEQASVAIKGIRARTRRIMTPEQLAALAKVGYRARNTTVESVISV